MEYVIIQLHGCQLKHLKTLKIVISNHFAIIYYNLIGTHDVICHKKTELQTYACILAPIQLPQKQKDVISGFFKLLFTRRYKHDWHTWWSTSSLAKHDNSHAVVLLILKGKINFLYVVNYILNKSNTQRLTNIFS